VDRQAPRQRGGGRPPRHVLTASGRRPRLHAPRQTGNDVRGTYNFGGGSNIRGTIDGKTFNFTYDQPDGEKGQGAYELAADGKSFKGTWQGAKGGANNGGAMDGDARYAAAGPHLAGGS
jgi:hypothetical protein